MEPDNPSAKDELDRAKSVLRLRMRAARRTVLPEQRAAHAFAIAERVLSLPELDGASTALLYGASPEEADPAVLEAALRELGIRIAYPRVAGDRELTLHWVDGPEVLVEGAYGLLQPVADTPLATLAEMAVVVVPGVAFDCEGNRLGFGGGYYDTLLGTPDGSPTAVGIAYDEQVVDHVPNEPRDRPLDVLVTPTRTLRFATSQP